MVGRKLARFLIDSVLVRRLPGPFVPERGRCWHVHLPRLAHLSDDVADCHRSPLTLYEDGRALRPAHSPHSEVRAIGHGCYSHWGECLFFSTSDNTDPNTNGRRYTYSVARWLYERRAYAPPPNDGLPPTNLRPRDVRPERIRADVAS